MESQEESDGGGDKPGGKGAMHGVGGAMTLCEAKCKDIEAACEAKCKDIKAAVEARVIAEAQAKFGRVLSELQARPVQGRTGGCS